MPRPSAHVSLAISAPFPGCFNKVARTCACASLHSSNLYPNLQQIFKKNKGSVGSGSFLDMFSFRNVLYCYIAIYFHSDNTDFPCSHGMRPVQELAVPHLGGEGLLGLAGARHAGVGLGKGSAGRLPRPSRIHALASSCHQLRNNHVLRVEYLISRLTKSWGYLGYLIFPGIRVQGRTKPDM